MLPRVSTPPGAARAVACSCELCLHAGRPGGALLPHLQARRARKAAPQHRRALLWRGYREERGA